MGIRKKALLYSCAIALAAGASALTAEDNEDALLGKAQQMFKPLPADASLNDSDVADIVAFLGTLTGDVPAQFAGVPSLPAAAYRN